MVQRVASISVDGYFNNFFIIITTNGVGKATRGLACLLRMTLTADRPEYSLELSVRMQYWNSYGSNTLHHADTVTSKVTLTLVVQSDTHK